MSTYTTLPTKGFGMAKKVTASAQDAIDGEVIVDFQVNFALAASVQILRSGAVVTGDAVVTYPAVGQVSVADGSTYSVTADDVIVIVADMDY